MDTHMRAPYATPCRACRGAGYTVTTDYDDDTGRQVRLHESCERCDGSGIGDEFLDDAAPRRHFDRADLDAHGQPLPDARVMEDR